VVNLTAEQKYQGYRPVRGGEEAESRDPHQHQVVSTTEARQVAALTQDQSAKLKEILTPAQNEKNLKQTLLNHPAAAATSVPKKAQ